MKAFIQLWDIENIDKEYAKKNYPRSYRDYYTAFIEQAVNLADFNGFIGMLTGRTFMFLKWYERVRKEVLLRDARSEIVFDLNSSPGDQVLDEATGRWSATIARKTRGNNEEHECFFFRLTIFQGEEEKINTLENTISLLFKSKPTRIVLTNMNCRTGEMRTIGRVEDVVLDYASLTILF